MSWDAVFPPDPERWQVAGVAFSRDGGAITVASLDSANNVAVIRRGDMTAGNGQPPTRLDGIRSIVLSPDGSSAAVAGTGRLQIVNAVTTRALSCAVSETPGRMAFSADGRLLAVAGESRVDVFETATGARCGQSAPDPAIGPNALAFSPDSAILARASHDGLRAYPLLSPKDSEGRQFILQGGRRNDRWRDRARVTELAFSPAGALLAGLVIGEFPVKVRVWRLARSLDTTQPRGRPRLAARLSGHRDTATHLAFSRRAAVAAGFGDGTVDVGSLRPWSGRPRRRTAQPMTLASVPASAVTGLAFSPDGRVLASAHADGTVWAWSSGHAGLRATLTGCAGPVQAIAFSPDGTRLAAATPDATVRFWDTRTWTLAATLTPEDPGDDH